MVSSSSQGSPAGWERLRSSYDAVAAAYEERFADELDDKPLDRLLLERFAGTASGPVVDLGCGPGQVGRFVADRDHEVVGVDLSRAMAVLAGRRLRTAVVADMRALPFGDGRIGAMVAFYSLIHLPRAELPAAALEIARVLRPGACLLVSAHGGEGEVTRDEFLGVAVPFVASLFDVEEVTTAFLAAGLVVTEVQSRPPYEREHPTTRIYVAAAKP